MKKQKPPSFLFISGSTGGHLFPLLPIAEGLKKRGRLVFFICAGSELEKKVLTKGAFDFDIFSVGRMSKGVSFFERIKTILSLPYFILRALYLILKKKPSIVMGAGGAVSGPVLLAAAILRKKTIIWELNALPGLAVKLSSFFINKIFIQFESAKNVLPKKKCLLFSTPVRPDIENIRHQKREPGGFSHLLILGGSQGSHKINQAVMDMYSKEDLTTWKIRHQTGLKDLNSILSVYKEDPQVLARAFFDPIAEHYLWADVVISRAGALTLSELSAAGKAAVVIPLLAGDQHQKKNAAALLGAVEVLDEKTLTGELLFEMVMSLHGKKKKKVEENIQKFYDPKSLNKIFHFLERF